MKFSVFLVFSLIFSQSYAQERVATFNFLVEGLPPMKVITAEVDNVREIEGVGLAIDFVLAKGKKKPTFYLPNSDVDMWILDAGLHEVKPVINLNVKNGVKNPGCVAPEDYDAPGGNILNCTIDRSSNLYFWTLLSIEWLSPNPRETVDALYKAGYLKRVVF